jgi:2-polyprenyl-3-methyl-5-hydroxy-6-metoxy-1,4-benzoquinol methylase
MPLNITEEGRAELTVEKVTACLLCCRQGSSLYRGLRDRTFGSPGEWNYDYCPECQLLWLASRPRAEDIGRFYDSYYTHDQTSRDQLRHKLKLALIARLLRSKALSPGPAWDVVARLMVSFPPFAESARMGSMLLGESQPGRLLDIGCGSGEFLSMMQRAGWDVAGIEPDAKAASVASRRLGRVIPTVELLEAGFEAGTFDAITLHHVIEHTYHPVGLMQECGRLLRPQGRLVMVTPNITSLGHRRFQGSWRGLEPPRHLYLFSPNSMRKSIGRAGLRVRVLQTSARMGRAIWSESRKIEDKNGSMLALLFQAYEHALCHLRPDCGEELFAVASPPDPSVPGSP